MPLLAHFFSQIQTHHDTNPPRHPRYRSNKPETMSKHPRCSEAQSQRVGLLETNLTYIPPEFGKIGNDGETTSSSSFEHSPSFEAPMNPLKETRTRKCTSAKTAYTKTHKRRVFVEHNYEDHASDPVEQLYRGGRYAKRALKRFPCVLHQMLGEIEEIGLSHIISWSPHGRAFVVNDVEGFVTQVMPRYFKQSRFSSFLRQLSLYGFIRLSRHGLDHHGYYHEFFLRGREDLAMAHMKRTRIKGTAIRYTSNPEAEPDFFSMPPVQTYEKISEVMATSQFTTEESAHTFSPPEEPPVFDDETLSTLFEEPILADQDQSPELATCTEKNVAFHAMPLSPFQSRTSNLPQNAAKEAEEKWAMCQELVQCRKVSLSPDAQQAFKEDQVNATPNEEGIQLDRLILSGLDTGRIARV